MIATAVIAMAVMGGFVVANQLATYRQELLALRSQNLDYQKRQLRDEVERTVSYIEFTSRTAQDRILEELRRSAKEAAAAAAAVATAAKAGGSPDAQVENDAVDVLRALRPAPGQYLVALDRGGRVRVWSEPPTAEGPSALAGGPTTAARVREMLAIPEATGEGFCRCEEPGPEGDGGFPLDAYVVRLEQLGWVIGAGLHPGPVKRSIQEGILERISGIHFENGGYLFVGTYEGISLTPPARGRNMYDVVDANGVKIVQSLISAARSGGGYVQYVMPGLDGRRQAAKLSYATAVPSWGWYVGAGAYLDDMEALIAERRQELRRSITTRLVESAGIFLGLLALILVSGQFARRRLQSSLDIFTRFFGRAAEGARIDAARIGWRELEALAVTVNTMVDLRVSAEQERRASEERYRSIVENIPDALLILDGHGQVLDVNDRAGDLFGSPRKDLVGTDARVLAGEELGEALDGMLHRLRSEGAVIFEASARPRRGKALDVEVSARLVAAGGDRVIQAIVRDISERKQGERAVRENEALLRTLMDNMGAGVMIVDAQSHTVDQVNAIAAEMMGGTPESICGRNCHHFLCPADVGACPITDLCKEADNSDRVLLRVDGSAMPVMKTVKRISLQGREKLVETFVDISERKRAEEERRRFDEQVRQMQKLESLGILAGGIAHDFNNILMTVLGNAELAAEDPALPPGARESLAEIGTAARRAAELCRQMLTYSGKAASVREAVDLRALVTETTQLVARSIHRKTQLVLRLDPDLPAVLGDPSQIRQVVMNLVINSSEAIGDAAGAITVAAIAESHDAASLGRLQYGAELPPGRYVHLEVTDTGCGMDGATQSRMFEPFFTTKFKGRGLGLASVLGIVRAHRGALEIASAPGQGTRFSVLLPALEAQAVPGQAACGGGEPRPRYSGRVLLAEDEETVRRLGRRMLEQLGFQVITVADGAEAVEVFRREHGDIALVVLDLTMPRMDGAEAVVAIRRIDPHARILLASGHSGEEVAGRFADAGISGVLQKPYTRASLREAIVAVLESAGGDRGAG